MSGPFNYAHPIDREEAYRIALALIDHERKFFLDVTVIGLEDIQRNAKIIDGLEVARETLAQAWEAYPDHRLSVTASDSHARLLPIPFKELEVER